jgi:HEAT repeat protein
MRARVPTLLALLLAGGLGACTGPSGPSGQAARPAGARLADRRKVDVSSLNPAEKRDIEEAWSQFENRSALWNLSLQRIVERGGAGPYVLAENLFRRFFTASIYGQKAEIERVADSAAVIGEPAVAYFAKPLAEDLVPLGKKVVARVPDPKDPSRRIPRTFDKFQIDDLTRRDAARVLVAIGAPAVPTLEKLTSMARARPSGRRYAAFALGRIGTDPAVAALAKQASAAATWQGRAAAVQALGAALATNPSARAPLEAARRDPDDFVRKEAERALAGETRLPF